MRDLTPVAGMPLGLDQDKLLLQAGDGIVALHPERRHVDDVRAMLEDRSGSGPDPLYTVYMGIANRNDAAAIHQQGLIYGSVLYNRGSIGQERLRGQGHVHSLKSGTPFRYSEVFEFWTGTGWVYLQRECAPIVTRALLVPFQPGDHLVVPFGWIHIVISDGQDIVSFGAWAARDNVLEYDALRVLGGPSYFLHVDGSITTNPRYTSVASLKQMRLSALPSLSIPPNRPLYTIWQEQPDLFDFIANPEALGDVWSDL
jgi:glucose-6-phosphate isomerase, archaeal